MGRKGRGGNPNKVPGKGQARAGKRARGYIRAMSTMNEPRFGDFGDQQPTPSSPHRTSVLAISSLVLGILGVVTCCVPVAGPVLGIVAMILGITAVIFISSSQGRLGGKGLAISGIACSVLALVAGIAMLTAIGYFASNLGHYAQIVKIAQSEDRSELPEYLTYEATAAATKESVDDFSRRVTEGLGQFQSSPTGLWAMLGGMMEGFSAVQRLERQIPPAMRPNFSQSVMAVPGEFEKGRAVMLFFTRPQEQGPKAPMGKVSNIAVEMPDGTLVWFLDPNPAPSPAPTPPDPAPDSGGNPPDSPGSGGG
jgi:hypothetical protein